MKRLCCLLAFGLLASIMLFLYTQPPTDFLNQLTSEQRRLWFKYYKSKWNNWIKSLSIGFFLSLFIGLVLENNILPVP